MTAPATRTFLSLGPTGLSLETECKHGHVGYCGMCDAEQAPKCEAHGRPWYCGECGRADGNPRPRHKRPGQWTDRTRARRRRRLDRAAVRRERERARREQARKPG